MQKKQIHVKFCDFWRGFDSNDNVFTTTLQKHYDVILSENPDFIIYSCFGKQHHTYANCVKIFYTGEAVTPNFNECDYAIGFDYMQFGDRYLRQSIHVLYDATLKASLTNQLAQRKFCNFIYSNSKFGKGSVLRQDFCKQLMQYKHVDCPGKVLNNMQDAIEPRNGDWFTGKLDFIKDYKFTIAFENCEMLGYVTEKLIQPLQVHSIPIYFGDPAVSRDFNPKAFVNCHDFTSFDDVIEHIKYLDNNDDAYMEMVRQPPMQADYVYDDAKLERFLVNIVEKGKKPIDKDPLGWGRRMSSFNLKENKTHMEPWGVRFVGRFGRSVRKRVAFIRSLFGRHKS